MPRKRNHKKPRPASPPKRANRPATKRAKSPHAAIPAGALYVLVSPPSVKVLHDRPATGSAAVACRDFDEAKRSAIEALVVAIEDAERQLSRWKRALSVEDLTA
jgi:hypothetical protein